MQKGDPGELVDSNTIRKKLSKAGSIRSDTSGSAILTDGWLGSAAVDLEAFNLLRPLLAAVIIGLVPVEVFALFREMFESITLPFSRRLMKSIRPVQDQVPAQPKTDSDCRSRLRNGDRRSSLRLETKQRTAPQSKFLHRGDPPTPF